MRARLLTLSIAPMPCNRPFSTNGQMDVTNSKNVDVKRWAIKVNAQSLKLLVATREYRERDACGCMRIG